MLKSDEKFILYLLIYVIKELKEILNDEFDMNDLCVGERILEMDIV